MRPPIGPTNHQVMNVLRDFLLTIRQCAKFACSLPRLAVNVIKQRRGARARHQLEVERLDRLRNPSQYAGK